MWYAELKIPSNFIGELDPEVDFKAVNDTELYSVFTDILESRGDFDFELTWGNKTSSFSALWEFAGFY